MMLDGFIEFAERHPFLCFVPVKVVSLFLKIAILFMELLCWCIGIERESR